MMILNGLLLAATAPDAGTSRVVVDLLMILVSAAVVSLVMSRLRLALIPAYLITGVLIGPHVLALVPDASNVQTLTQLALILLMFGIGLHLDLTSFRGALGSLVMVGLLSTTLSVLCMWPVGLALGLETYEALSVAMALSLSSTAVVLRTLQARRELRHAAGRVSFSVLIVQDLLVIAMLAALPWIAKLAGVDQAIEQIAQEGQADNGGVWGGVLAVAKSVGGIALLMVIGKIGLPRIFAEAARAKSGEVLLVLSAAVALAAALAAGALGFSPELGAFLAGFLLAGTPFRYQIAGQLMPMRDLFMAVFFTTVSLEVDPLSVMDNAAGIGIGLVAVMLIKACTIGGSAWLTCTSARVASTSGIQLAQAGEFSLVVLIVALDQGLVSPEIKGAAITIVVLSLMLTPTLIAFAPRLGGTHARLPTLPWVERKLAREHAASGRSHDEEDKASKPTIILAGFGPVGRAIAEQLEQNSLPFTIIELNPTTVQTQRKLGRSVVFGDVTNPEVLESAGIHDAPAVILTMPDDDAMLRACKAVRAVSPDVLLAARATYLSRAMQAQSFGANYVAVEELATAAAMAQEVLKRVRPSEQQENK